MRAQSAWPSILGVVLALAVLAAPQSHAAEEVDVALVLAVDVSLSMSREELEIQRRGYAAALLHDHVLQAIADGARGRVAVAYVEWAGSRMQRVVVPWTVIAGREDAQRVVAQLSAQPPNSARRTSISGALAFAGDMLAESGFQTPRRVIDISGDGPNNEGAPVADVRDALTRRGITINGLPLMTNGGFTTSYDIGELDRYYADCVIGGPGAFMVPVNDWDQFPEAVRRKLVMELADAASPRRASAAAASPPVMLAQARPSADCLIGERMWRNRNWFDDRGR
jgi:hypothetical protein